MTPLERTMTVMAGLVPAIYVFSFYYAAKTWMPGIADKFT
jgi:hypothetical protein